MQEVQALSLEHDLATGRLEAVDSRMTDSSSVTDVFWCDRIVITVRHVVLDGKPIKVIVARRHNPLGHEPAVKTPGFQPAAYLRDGFTGDQKLVHVHEYHPVDGLAESCQRVVLCLFVFIDDLAVCVPRSPTDDLNGLYPETSDYESRTVSL